MANNEQEVRIGDDIHSKEEEHVDPNTEGRDHNGKVQEVNPEANNVTKGRDGSKKSSRDEYYCERDLQVWRDRCRRKYEETEKHGKYVDRSTDSGQPHDAEQRDAIEHPHYRTCRHQQPKLVPRRHDPDPGFQIPDPGSQILEDKSRSR